jgi:ABC-2 type transport system ATP-binding protein
MPAAIEFHVVSKAYHRLFRREYVAALSDISFEAERGEVCAFLGPNGAGKTTSINLLMGFQFADFGKIRVLGYEPGDVRAKRQIGFLPENFAFYKYMTAGQLLQHHLTLAERETDGASIPDLLAKVRLSDYKALRIGKYSRGMVQRLGIAQALLGDPQLLVLDEPTSGLDPAGRKDILELLATLKTAGKTVFLSSHILPEVEQICDRIIIIDRGRLVRAGKKEELLAQGSRVEIVVDQLPETAGQAAAERGGSIEPAENGVHLVFDASVKREMAEMLWSAGCDIVSMNPVRSSLQELFLKLVKDYEEIA